MFKTISTSIALTIILILAIAVGIVDYWQYTEIQNIKLEVAEIRIPEKIDEKTSNEFLEVISPFPYQRIISPVLVSGKSNFFEANTRIRIKDNNNEILADIFTTAEGWLGELYPFSKEVSYNKPSIKEGVVEVFEESAKDGREIKKITIPVIFED